MHTKHSTDGKTPSVWCALENYLERSTLPTLPWRTRFLKIVPTGPSITTPAVTHIYESDSTDVLQGMNAVHLPCTVRAIRHRL